MTAIIVSGHGQISTGIIDAFEMIFGKDEKVIAIPFFKGEGIPQLQEKFQQQLEQFKGEPILFMVDIFGGTPYNAATQLIYGRPDMEVVTGVNLPMLLESSNMKDTMTLEGLVNLIRVTNQDSFKVFTEQIKKIQEKTEEDELL